MPLKFPLSPSKPQPSAAVESGRNCKIKDETHTKHPTLDGMARANKTPKEMARWEGSGGAHSFGQALFKFLFNDRHRLTPVPLPFLSLVCLGWQLPVKGLRVKVRVKATHRLGGQLSRNRYCAF